MKNSLSRSNDENNRRKQLTHYEAQRDLKDDLTATVVGDMRK